MMDQPEAARTYYQEALVLAEKGLHTRLEADLLRRLTGVYEVLEDPERGIASGKRAITLHQTLRDLDGEAALWVLLASLYQMTGKENDKEQALQRALLIYRHRQFPVHAGS
jgi:tetratricopeptide (TPR) repeat protein